MNILLYVDPWVDISDKPEFKLPWIRSFLDKTITNLYYHAKTNQHNIKITLLYSDILDGNNLREDHDFIDFVTISQKEIKNIFINFDEYLCLQRDNINHEKFKTLDNLIKSKLENYSPDIIILMSSSCKYLNYVFPNTPTLFVESGIFAQKPYPGCLYFDNSPAMDHESFLPRNKEKLLSFEMGKKEKHFLRTLRDFFLEKIREQNPYQQKLKEFKSKFDHVVLLSLQRFSSPLFRTTSEFKDQIEYVDYVFQNLDPKIGVIVTEHRKDRMLGFEAIRNYFKNKYPNFLYIEDTDKVDNSSQFLLQLVDGVITISSTVGLQTMIHQKPLFVPSKISYLSAIADVQDLKLVMNYLSENKYNSKDQALYYLLTHYYLTSGYYQNGEWFYNFLNRSIKNYKNEDNFLFYDRIDSDEMLLRHMIGKKKGLIARLKNSINKRLTKWQARTGQ